eukprot:TRINITY_DN1864_c0_g1_i2.p1 TRINITY_DN1864_c0_g1~~TRINITY_DN1864_c0_g1_i2.p1  ORF type:complete len:1456 (+),score=157.69 TRINITY_DN1864_c0_g1_i2:62-4429(+)
MEHSIFSSLVFCVSGFPLSKTSELKRIIQTNGGRISSGVQRKTTHLVTSVDEYLSNSENVRSGLDRGLIIVGSQFIYDCEEQHTMLPEKSYVPVQPLPHTKQNTENESATNSSESSLVGNGASEKNSEPALKSEGKWRSARVFISSTFRDMHGERDHLTRYVIPELQERCKKLRVHVTPVDLRWGVTEEDTQNALEICLLEIENCRPFFIGLLGSRYGWVPTKYVFGNDDQRFDWLSSTQSGKSITHLEMISGALKNPGEAKAVFCFRDPSFTQNVPPQYQADFRSENIDYSNKLDELKADIRKSVPQEWVLEDYSCLWKGVIDGKPMVGELEQFGNHVLETMWKHFKEVFPVETAVSDDLAIARSFHENFVENHSRHFIGRTTLMDNINSGVFWGTNLQVIIGEPGSGKTSLVCAFVNQFIRNYGEQYVVIPHFVGAAPNSTNIRMTLTRLCKEIMREFDLTEEIPEEYRELKAAFSKLLGNVQTKSGRTKSLLIVIDALNQFDETFNASSMDWLPEQMPANVWFVVSTLKGVVLDNLRKRPSVHEVSVGELTMDERREIVRQTLWEYRKKLDERPGKDQMALLLAKKDSHKPLYLITACEELRVFGVYEQVSARIAKMSDKVGSLLEEVLERLEGDHGVELVTVTLSLLTCSRGGLLEVELLQMLDSPPYAWSRLYRSMSAFLRPPGESGEGMLDFFHRQLAKAVERKYLAGKPRRLIDTHRKLASFFLRQADPDSDFSWSSNHRRGLSELPFHLLQAKEFAKLKEVLSDLVFIEKKCAAGMTYELVGDYLTVSASPDIPAEFHKQMEDFQRFVQARTHILCERPELTFSMASSLPDMTSPASAARKRWESGAETRPYIRYRNKPQAMNACLMTLTGHALVIRCCAISPDNKKIASASDDNTIKIWDFKTGAEMQTLRGHKSSVFCCTFSHAGDKLITGSFDKSLKLWNANTGVEILTVAAHSGQINSVCFNPSDNLFASASQDATLRVWNLYGAPIACISDYVGPVFGCDFSSDGKYLASASADNKVFVYSTESWAKLHTFSHPKSAVRVRFSPTDPHCLASSSDDKTIKVWNLQQPNNVVTMVGHKDGVCSIGFSPDGKHIVSGSYDNFIIIWNVDTGDSVAMITGHTGTVFHCVYTSDAKYLVSSSFDRSVKVWEVSRAMASVSGHTARVLGVAFSKDAKTIVTASRDKTLKVWDSSGNELRTLTGHLSNVFGCDISPDGQKIVSASRDHTLRIWSLDGRVLSNMTGHRLPVTDVRFSVDGRTCVSASDDKLIKIWDVETGAEIHTLYGHRDTVNCVDVSQDGRRIVSGSSDSTLKLWDTRTRSKVATLCGHKSGVASCAFSPNSDCVLSGGEDYIIKEWSARNAKQLHSISRHKAAVSAVAYTPSGRHFISGSTDSLIILFNNATKEEVCAFSAAGRITTLAISEGSEDFIAGDGSGTLYVLQPCGILL